MYHLFAGQGYYPNSGLGDYVDSYETLEEAEAMGKKKLDPQKTQWTEDWYSVVTERDKRLIEVASGWGRL